MTGGLSRRILLAYAILVTIISLSFGALILAVNGLNGTVERSDESREVLTVANGVERLVVDLETGQRGFLLTNDSKFLQPWKNAQQALPGQLSKMRALVAGTAEQETLVDRLADAVNSYIVDYSVPAVNAASAGSGPQDLVGTLDEGRNRLDSIRSQFDQFIGAESKLVADDHQREESNARRVVALAGGGLAASMILGFAFILYLRRAVLRPIGDAAGLAGQFSLGDLRARMPETGIDEIGDLERSFNTMAESLEANLDERERFAAEQAALRRVATLVAEGRPSDDVFAAVAEQMARLFHADIATVQHFQPDGSIRTVGRYGPEPGEGKRPPPVHSHGESPPAAPGLSREPGPAHEADEEPAGWLDIRSVVNGQIVVEGRPWGLIAVGSRRGPFPEDTEQRMAGFSELIATAVASAEARNELIASRGRIITASDDARRKIERDLHDGAQQGLVTLAMELRDASSRLPDGLTEIREQLSKIGDALDRVLDDLREISRGIHPAILSQGGLPPALRALGRRSGLPVEVNVDINGRLPERIEVAAYYLVSEALTNTAKHARATNAQVSAVSRRGWLELSVHDDGVGGADPERGSGLVGLKDRAAALGGSLDLTSPRGQGTTLTARLPLSGE